MILTEHLQGAIIGAIISGLVAYFTQEIIYYKSTIRSRKRACNILINDIRGILLKAACVEVSSLSLSDADNFIETVFYIMKITPNWYLYLADISDILTQDHIYLISNLYFLADYYNQSLREKNGLRSTMIPIMSFSFFIMI